MCVEFKDVGFKNVGFKGVFFFSTSLNAVFYFGRINSNTKKCNVQVDEFR